MLAALLALLFSGCGDNDPYLAYSYVRQAADFTIDTARADTLCEDPGPAFVREGFDPVATCKATRKLKLTWKRPDDTVAFRGYLLYLDTTRGDKPDWKRTQERDQEALVAIPDPSSQELGIVIFLYDRKNPPPGIAEGSLQDTAYPGARRVIGVDTSGRMEEDLGRFVFALATRYGGDKTPGQPQYTRIIVGDKFPPNPFAPRYQPGPRSLGIAWARPTDPTSFFDPGRDTGIVARYVLSLRLSGDDSLEERYASFKPRITWTVGGAARAEGIRDTAFLHDRLKLPNGMGWFLPDSNRASRLARGEQDSLRVLIEGLKPRERLDVNVYAVDSAGNANRGAMSTTVTVRLTDTTRPTTPDLQVIDSLTTRNSFRIRWTASRDLVAPEGGGEPVADTAPNYNIEEYRLTRVLLRDSGDADTAAADRRDTVIKVTTARARDSVFVDSVRFLPPGRSYFLRLVAVDSSGYVSLADSLVVTTRAVAFTGPESSLTCPPGFIPIPSARVALGDASSSGRPDEKPPEKPVTMGSFCIEPYEHRDSTGRFVVNKTWEEADAICKAISAADETQLCSEVEWERACEGFDFQAPHSHGIQSQRDPSILQSSCNQFAGDAAMAMSLALRNPVCLTNEGVYDMAGNLSEWVRDNYDSAAYSLLKDTVLAHGSVLPVRAGRSDTVRGIRGGNYLKAPNVSPAVAQALARCSNRDFPMQVRPLSRPECRGDGPKVAVIYQANSLAGHRCVDIPGDLPREGLVDVAPTPGDTTHTQLTFFYAGKEKTRTMEIERDTTFRGRKIVDAQFTTPSLVEVVFERVAAPQDSILDTLDAREMRDTSQAALERILLRESPSAAWRPRKAEGRFVTRRFYGYPVLGSSPAKPFFASRSVGFRCCSKPRPAAPVTPASPLARRAR